MSVALARNVSLDEAKPALVLAAETPLAEAAAPYYERLDRHKLAVGGVGET